MAKSSDLVKAKKVLRRLIDAINEYSGDKYFDDEDEMQKSGAKVDRAVAAAEHFLRAAKHPATQPDEPKK